MNLKAENPIGIFDSGVGGLTVANAIFNQLPNEQLIYFGDTAHLPYGDKSPQNIIRYAQKITSFLLSEGCKAVIIACNSASSHAYDILKKEIGEQAFLINVIDPVVDYVAKQQFENVGIIGTRATIKANVYEHKIKKAHPLCETHSLETPLLASYIEEGFFRKKEITQLVLREYLSKPTLKNIKALILACTHYPLIKADINFYYDQSVHLVDSTDVVADFVSALLSKHQLLNSSGNQNHKKDHCFYASDLTPTFEQTAQMFFKNPLNLQEKILK